MTVSRRRQKADVARAKAKKPPEPQQNPEPIKEPATHTTQMDGKMKAKRHKER